MTTYAEEAFLGHSVLDRRSASCCVALSHGLRLCQRGVSAMRFTQGSPEGCFPSIAQSWAAQPRQCAVVCHFCTTRAVTDPVAFRQYQCCVCLPRPSL